MSSTTDQAVSGGAVKTQPERQDTSATTLSTSSTTEILENESTVKPKPSFFDRTGLSAILMDAVRFSEVLANDSADKEKKRLSSNSDVASESSDETAIEEDAESVRRFADLVGRDLDKANLPETERFAKITANSWLSESDGLDGRPSAEPEAYELETESPPVESTELLTESPREEKEQQIERSTVQSATSLAPEEIVKLLVDEFGPLTTDAGEEECLICEKDGAYFQEVAILGMVHLTTHRIAFHASLLSARPDLLPDQQIIKTGYVTIHRPGLRRKRRVWVELSHDMLTTFPSSKEEDRIKPLRSYLLSQVKEVLEEDPKRPKWVDIVTQNELGVRTNHVEVDTEESAREWRKEISAAVYIYRRRRANSLYKQTDDESNGVRISIPLSRIKNFTTRKFLSLATTVIVEFTPSRQDSAISRPPSPSPPPTSNDSEPASSEALEVDSDSDSDSDDEESSIQEQDFGGRSMEISVINELDSWQCLGQLIETAKNRERGHKLRASPRVFADFGELTFLAKQPAEEEQKTTYTKEDLVRNALTLGEGEIWYERGRIVRNVTSSGYFAVSHQAVGFWSKNFSHFDLKYRLPISKVIGARPNYRYRLRAFGMILDIKEHPSMSFDFSTQEKRDEAIKRVAAAVSTYQMELSRSSLNNGVTPPALSKSSSETSTLTSPSTGSSTSTTTSASSVLSPLSLVIERTKMRNIVHEDFPKLPKVINLPSSMLPNVAHRHFVCLTIGSRGDVQPYIALARGLQRAGHKVTIVTHEEYKDWVTGWGIEHRTAGGDPGALMKLSVEHKMFSPQFFKESLTNFRSWLDSLLADAWKQCQDADVLLESPVAMAGVHIAEALNIPYFRVFTMPWTKTTEFPHPFLSAPVDLATFNASSYILFDNVFWTATSGQINRFRRKILQLESTDMGHMAQSKITFIYNFSPSVVPKPLDWGDTAIISGYWFLDNSDIGWKAPESLLQFMKKAKDDAKAIVYIGFGSITVPNPPAMTRSIIKAVKKSDVRAIVSKGWSSRMSKPGEVETEMPPECYSIDKIPHDWLFPQISAALHHGGAGTTGASLRAGIPTLIKPWFGDQFFWASRVQALGAGLKVSSLRSSELAAALLKATSDRMMKERASAIGEKIRSEDGVTNAIRALYTYLPRAARDRTSLQ